MSYQNPDYPIPGTYGSFISNTYMAYEQPQQTQYMFYPGFGATPQAEYDSRRTPPTQSFAPMMQPTIPQQPVVQPIQPFSAYGGSGTQMSAPLSSPMADSRRYQPTPAPAANPWAAPLAPSSIPQTAAIPQQPQWDMQFNNQVSPFAAQDSRMVPLANGFQVPGFDKRVGVWDNCFTEARPFPQPVVAWNAPANPNAQTFTPVSQMASTPFNQVQPVQQTWMELFNGYRNGGI